MDDLLSSPAFIFLAEQVAAGVISTTTAETYKARYTELYRTAHNAIEREKDSVSKARDLRALVREEQISLEKCRIRKEQLEGLAQQAEVDRKKLATTLNEIESRDSRMVWELNELKIQETELTEDVAALARDNESTVLPLLQAMANDIADARADIARASTQIDSLMSTKAMLNGQVSDLEMQSGAARTTSNAMRVELMRVRGEPERVGSAVDAIKAALDASNGIIASAKVGIASRELEMEEQHKALTSVAGVKRDLDAKLAKYRQDIEAREAEVKIVERSLWSERTQYKDLLERRIDLQTEEAAAGAGTRSAEAERDAIAAAYERSKREFKRKTDAANDATAEIPGLEAQIAERRLELGRLESEGHDADEKLTTLKRDMDVLLAQFMKTEGIEKKHKLRLTELVETAADLDNQKEQWHREELLCQKQISALKAQRDIKSRDLAKMVSSRKTTVEQSKVKELQLLDLTKQLGDINNRLRQFGAMYEVVKNERNTFANNIQSASQSIAEMRERIKILHNEIDILKNESHAKDKALAKEHQAHAIASVQRDALRAEANKFSLAYREKQSLVEGQIMAIDKLNSIINGLEREMLALKKQYEVAVETRNYTGIQLIDRNDELCILYEKSNIHEKTLSDGERQLRVISEESRALNLAIQDLERQLHIAKTKFPETPIWAERLLELQKQLVQSRQVTEKLCLGLETPTSSDRWVDLGGEDPDADRLKLRVVELESRVNAAREELLEKDLILEEITSLAARLEAAASSASLGSSTPGGGAGRTLDTPGLSMAKTANDLQGKIKDLNRKMMAVVSELSMYQATSIKLAAEASSAHESVISAESALREGRAPTMQAEHKWQSMERARILPPGVAFNKLDVAIVDGPKTTSEVRPNAYIPEGIGLPKPYGEFAPFKPTETGAIMRFYRNPEVKEIEL